MRKFELSTLASHCLDCSSTAALSASSSRSEGKSGAAESDKDGCEEMEEEGVLRFGRERGEDGTETGPSEGGVDGEGGLDCDEGV